MWDFVSRRNDDKDIGREVAFEYKIKNDESQLEENEET
jgi:hypothetical protein